MMALGDIAALLPWPVFACDGEKRPVVRSGFKAATRDAAAIMEQFATPGAEMIGVPTGAASGLIVIDVDIKNGARGQEWLDENIYALPETRTHKTRSGGLHLVFRAPEGVEIRNSAGRVAPGIDVRGEGGYVIVPPSPGYAVADPTEPEEMPRWLIKACMRQEPEPATAPRYDGPRTDHPYVRAALDNECSRVSSAGEGTRNDTLNLAALKLGHYVAGGYLSRSEAESRLLNAAKDAGLPHREAAATIKSGLDAGERTPKEPPERERPPQAQPSARQPETRPVTPPETSPLPLEFFADMRMSSDVADFVEGLLIEAAMSVVYGQSNSGKTFWLLNLALHVAAGMPWHGRDVTQGPVIWLAMEGAYGIRNRVEAWKRHHGMEDANVPFAVVPVALDLLDPAAATDKLISTIDFVAAKFEVPVRLTVVDTLSRAIAGGNENSPEDMGALVTNGTKIQQATKSHLSWIHHSGKDDAKGARGHSLLRAATDTEIEITADGAQRTARVSKQRELDCAGEFSFTLKVVDLGNNKRGKPVTSCVVEGLDEGHTAGAVLAPRLKGHVRRALDVLHDLLAESGKGGYPGVPTGVISVPEDWWRERFYDRTASDGKNGLKQDSKRAAFNRAVTELQDRRLIGLNKGRIWSARGQTFDQTEGQTE